MTRKKGYTRPPNCFSEFVNLEALDADPSAELLRVALLVRRAGLVVTEPTLAEVHALAAAGDQIADEHALLLVMKARDFAMALKPYDDGRAVDAEILDLAEARLAARCAAKNGTG